jgi:hypothetical protein
MYKLVWALLLLPAHFLFAGCLSFLDPPDGSGCSRSTNELAWLNSNRLLERVKVEGLPYDPRLYDPALSQGLAVKGDLEFELHASGPHLIEIFLVAEDDPRYSFVLEAAGKPVDTRYKAIGGAEAPGQKKALRSVCLLGMLSGAFTVRSNAPRYIISAIRWTPRREFEERLSSAWLERARGLLADPFLDDLRSRRRDSLEQLYDRLALSVVPEIRAEAAIGQARASYWLAAANPEARNLVRAAALLRQAFKLAPENKIVREMVSSFCAGRNVQDAPKPQAEFCGQAVPVYWTLILTPDPPGAPEWAVNQRRFAARLQAITEWWVERRQRPNGELGGGWGGDVKMLEQWGPQALGFGSPAAAAGILKMGEGVRGSAAGVSENLSPLLDALRPFYVPSSRSDPAQFQYMSSPDPAAALPLLAELAKAGEAALARDFDMYTSEVIYTNRVFYGLSPEYRKYLFGGEAAGTGIVAGLAVTWPASAAQFARAVLEANATGLRLRFFNFENKPVDAPLRLWRIEPGTYQWESQDPSGAVVAHGEFYVSRPAQTVNLPLPPFKEIAVTVRKFK